MGIEAEPVLIARELYATFLDEMFNYNGDSSYHGSSHESWDGSLNSEDARTVELYNERIARYDRLLGEAVEYVRSIRRRNRRRGRVAEESEEEVEQRLE